MGCCENINNIFGNNNDNLSESFYLNGLKEINFENRKKHDSIYIDNNVMNSLLKSNKFSKIQLDGYKKYKILDKINEVDSEYKESSINTRLISKEIVSPQNNVKIINKLKNKKDNDKLTKIKNFRKTRSLPEFKTILNEDLFYKKLNEYNENNKLHNNKINKDYHISLKKLDKSKTELKFNLEYDKAMENFNNKDNTFSFSKK
jgi:hypothetical protein